MNLATVILFTALLSGTCSYVIVRQALRIARLGERTRAAESSVIDLVVENDALRKQLGLTAGTVHSIGEARDRSAS